MKLVPVTIDEVRKSEDRKFALGRYHQWVKRERERDKKNAVRQYNRIYCFKNKEKVRLWKKKSRLKEFINSKRVRNFDGENVWELSSLTSLTPSFPVEIKNGR